tara:strand:- start:77 stop:220 length:144 start_codon:yes stop_codon:yes gene_type:complete
MLNFESPSKFRDLADRFNEVREIVMKKNKYLNICIVNFIIEFDKFQN